MHEYSLAMSILSRVAAEARRRGALAVHALDLEVGELAGVEPELLRGAYELAREGTACERAELRLTVVPARFSCPRCGHAFARGERLACAACGGEPARLEPGGRDLVLAKVELEVP